MSGARKYVSMGLVLLVCTLTGHCGEGAPSVSAQSSSSSSSRESQSEWRRMMEMVRHAENARSGQGSRTDAPATSRARVSTAEPRSQKTDRAEKSVGELGVSLRAVNYATLTVHFSRSKHF